MVLRPRCRGGQDTSPLPGPAPSPAARGHLQGPCDLELLSWTLCVLLLFAFILYVLDYVQHAVSSSGEFFIGFVVFAIMVPSLFVFLLKVAFGDVEPDGHTVCKFTGETLCTMIPLLHMFCVGAALMLLVQTIDPAKSIKAEGC